MSAKSVLLFLAYYQLHMYVTCLKDDDYTSSFKHVAPYEYEAEYIYMDICKHTKRIGVPIHTILYLLKGDLQQQHPQKHFDICIDQPLTLSASFGAPKLRQRAKSFPSEAPMNTLPMLELPQQAKEQHTMEETQIACTQDITPQTTGIKKTPEVDICLPSVSIHY